MERDSDHSHTDDPDGELAGHRIFDAFAACRAAFDRLGPTTSEDASLEPPLHNRRDLARLTITVIGLWDTIYIAGDVNIHQAAPTEGIEFALYADGMLSYNLLNTIGDWNGLHDPESNRPDRDDVELARALVRFLDLALGTDYYTDICKRSTEAIGDMLIAFPELLQTMVDEAQTRSFAPELQSAVEAIHQQAMKVRQDRPR